VALCDNRLNTKSYGKGMLKSLPTMRSSSDLEEIKAFARQIAEMAGNRR
jgi:Rad3-related DNA helicase